MKHATVAAMLGLTSLTALAVGCGQSGATGDGALAVEVGSGEWEFVPLVDGDEVSLIAGSQGGFHVWTSVRADVASPDHVRLDVTTTTDGSPFAPESSSIDVSMTPVSGDGMYAFLGWPARLLHPGCARDHVVHLHVRVTDSAGATGEDERDVLVRWDPPSGVDASCE